jgi:hypothetical protein
LRDPVERQFGVHHEIIWVLKRWEHDQSKRLNWSLEDGFQNMLWLFQSILGLGHRKTFPTTLTNLNKRGLPCNIESHAQQLEHHPDERQMFFIRSASEMVLSRGSRMSRAVSWCSFWSCDLPLLDSFAPFLGLQASLNILLVKKLTVSSTRYCLRGFLSWWLVLIADSSAGPQFHSYVEMLHFGGTAHV